MLKSGCCLVAFLFTFSLIFTFSNPADASEQLLLDKVLTISDWYVHASQHSFEAADAREARIIISKNKPDKEIQRGFMVLNGTFTFLRDFLVGDELIFEKDVTLQAANTLVVFLLGSPGATVSMQILQGEVPSVEPEIKSFTAAPTAIKRGESATLTWQTAYADSCKIEPGVGTVDPNGSVSVAPTNTTIYTLTAEGTSGPVTTTVTVTIENSAPVAEQQTVGSDEDTAVAITLTATDLDGDSLTYAVTIQPGKGTLSGTPPALIYNPNTNYNGPDAFSFTASDGAAISEAATINIVVKPINDSPQANDDPATTYEDTPVAIDNLLANDTDADNDPLTITDFTPPANGTLEQQADDSFAYTPNLNFSGEDSFTYTISDGNEGTASATVRITVISTNDPPVANAQSVDLTEDQPIAITLGASDADGDSLTFSIDMGPSHGDLSGDAPNLTYTPHKNYNGNDSFSFKAHDGQINSDAATVNLKINEINDAPVARAGLDQTVFVGDTVTLDGGGSGDVDEDILNFTWSFISTPAGSSAALSDPSAMTTTFTPDISGTYEIRLIVSDGEFNSSPDQVVITANPRVVDVPNVVHMAQPAAEAAIVDADLKVGTITMEHNETVPEGHVINQNPAEGTSVVEDSSVNLTISLGSVNQPPLVNFNASPSTIAQGESSTLNWSSLRGESAHIDNDIGTVSTEGTTNVSPEHTTTYTLTVTGLAGSENAKVTVQVTAIPEPQPKGTYGEQYEDLVPGDATVDQYDPERFSLITGLVNDINQVPLPGVTITVHSHTEYGSVSTDDQGRFSIPVEGGGTLTVVYQKQGLIPAQRKVYVPWNDNAIAETVVMITEDPIATTLTFDDNAGTVVTHKSEDVIDESGTRAVTMVISGDNKAYLVDEHGNDVQELTTITTRATEYPTPEAMPAKLPPNSAFTYCAELSVDGVQRVRFEKPVTTFIDNFLGFPVGSIVPVGYYDRDKGVWVPSENGIVVELLDTDSDGVVDALDAGGDGQPDDLDVDGSFVSEVKGLGDSKRYAPGTTFWRIQMNHFTPFDCNWPFGPPADAIASNAEGTTVVDQQNSSLFGTTAGQSRGDIQCVSSFVEQRSRVFHEDIPIPGTDMALHYTSSRVTGYKPGVISVPVSGEAVPESLIKIIVRADVAGKKYEVDLPPEPNQIAEIEWDGFDYLGRPVKDSVVAHVRIGFVYYGVYFSPNTEGRAFGQAGIDSLTVPTRQEVTIWNDSKMPIIIGKGSLAEGWTLSAHHQTSLLSQNILLKGDGTISRNHAAIIETYAGDGSGSKYFEGMGGAATSAKIPNPSSLAMDMEGNLYIFSSHLPGYQNWRSYILKVNPEGIVTTFAGVFGFYGYNGYMAADTQGNIYYSAYLNWYGGPNGGCIKKVTPEGENTTVVGECGPDDYSFSGIVFRGMHIDNQGNIYAAVSTHKVLKMDSAGILTVVAGNGTSGSEGDGGPAIQAQVNDPTDVYLDDEGNLYIAERYRGVRKVDPSGIISTVAGGGAWGTIGDGGPATEAHLYGVEEITMDSAGNLYIVESWNNSVRKVDNHGVITTVAGLNNNSGGYSGDGIFATLAQLNSPTDVLIDPAGNIFIADMFNGRVRKVSAATAGIEEATSEYAFSYTEESGLAYIMASDGRHMKTTDLNTGVSLHAFGYDGENNLVALTDQFGNTTRIERDAATNVATAIISPDGIRTELSIDTNNHLNRLTYADGSFYDFEYASDGLMLAETEPAGNRFEHIFDDKGRLKAVLDQEGGHWTYTRAIDINSEILTEVLSAEGDLTSFLDHTDSTGRYTSTITDPTGALTYFEQSDDGLIENHSLPCGTDLEYIYDLDSEYKYKYAKQMTESTQAGLTRITTIDKTYTDTDDDDIADLIVETVSVNGKATGIDNDTLAAQKTVTSPEGRTITSRYDPATLQVESVSVTDLHPTNYIYDTRGRLTSVSTGTRQSAFTYTTDGFLESVSDSEGQTTSYEYDPIGRMTGVNRPDGNFVDFSYDENGNMTVLINPAGTEHTFGYNRVNLNSSYTTPKSGSYSYVYDKDRRLIQTNFPTGQQISNTYENGRLVQTQTPGGNIDYTYLCSTKIESITKGAESITYSYDGKLVTIENLGGTLNQSLEYTYNNDFDVSTFTYAGQTENYSYDNDGLLTAAGDFAISRNVENGLPESVVGGTFNLTRSFNGYGEVEEQGTIVNSQKVASWNLTRDNNGRITQKTEFAEGVTSEYSYTYDHVGRLLTVTKDGLLVEEYRYDPNGTRNYEMNASREIGGRDFTYSEEDHLLTTGDIEYEYNDNGFLMNKTNGTNITNYVYSLRGELLSVNLPDERTIEYVHDPLGRRIAKRVDGVTTEKYFWQGLTRLLAVYDGSDNILMRFEYADDRVPVAVTTGGVTYYLAYDQVGSLRVVADSGGNVIKRIDYDSFGNIIAETNEDLMIPIGFAGGLYDRDTGLLRFGYRDYDPDVGRWTAKDPILFAGGDTDLYGYVLNDPINLIDSEGLAGIALDFGGDYSTGWGGSSGEGGSAGTGVYFGAKNWYAEFGGFTYQQHAIDTGKTPAASLGLGANLTIYLTEAEKFFPGKMRYVSYVIGPFSTTFSEDPCSGELTGITFSLGGKGFGWVIHEQGYTNGLHGPLQ
ncbi:MAG: Ig-like domain-containing protein [Desulfobacterales bacterium]|jgi:RHS repeat-associated protein